MIVGVLPVPLHTDAALTNLLLGGWLPQLAYAPEMFGCQTELLTRYGLHLLRCTLAFQLPPSSQESLKPEIPISQARL
jgi:hypothetical protein